MKGRTAWEATVTTQTKAHGIRTRAQAVGQDGIVCTAGALDNRSKRGGEAAPECFQQEPPLVLTHCHSHNKH